METLTRKELIRQHRKMWNWLADNPVNENGDFNKKRDWPGWADERFSKVEYESYCFACFYYENFVQNWDTDCGTVCLFRWKNEISCSFPGGEFRRWRDTESVTRRSYWARQIANLPVRRMR